LDAEAAVTFANWEASLMRKTIGASYIILIGIAAVAIAYSCRSNARAKDNDDKVRRLDVTVRSLCGSRDFDLPNMSHYMYEVARHGNPPGINSEALGGWMLARTRVEAACGVDPEERRQMSYIDFLTDTEQWATAAERVSQLAKTKRELWTKLEVIMPRQELADGALILHRHLHEFALSAWERWHPDAGNDPQNARRAQVFTLLDGGARAWHIALANRMDMFAAGASDAGLADAIKNQLDAVGLHVEPPAAGEETLVWAWSALDREFERLAREAETETLGGADRNEVMKLRDGPYDYPRFRDVLAHVRSDSSKGPP
jgi:hypothetical protein